MRSISLLLLSILVTGVCVSAVRADEVRVLALEREPLEAEVPDQIVPDEIVVVFDEPTTAQVEALAWQSPDGLQFTGVEPLDELTAAFGVTQLRKQFPGADAGLARQLGLPDLSGYFIVRFDPDVAGAEEVLAAYLQVPGVVHGELIGVHPVYATPNDGYYSNQWHLNQSSDRDMDGPEGWDIETGDPSVIVAVLDTGVRYFHKDLGGSNASYSNPGGANGNMWINWSEKNGSAGVDDDGNGYVDDWVGWDFVTGVSGCWSGEDCSTADNDPRDFNGHGTHCAGNVAAINNNGYAVASPAGGWGSGSQQPAGNGVKAMALRIGWSGNFLGQEVGYVRMDFAASAFYYAANNGAVIATCSWGSSNSGGIAAAIGYFLASGGLIFKAAGNSNNQTADYMCGRADVYCVAATDQSDHKASFSSYGTWVDISAPGVSIYSTYHNHSAPSSDYVAALSGTSMATPLVASVAAAVWSQNPTWTPAQVWQRVRDTADDIDALNPSYAGRLGSGRVNLFNAVNTGGPDCNGNGVPDAEDIANGTSEDCNGNGVPDECDIADGTSQDDNGNGIPDECETAAPPVLLVFTAATTVPGVGTVQNEDIVEYDPATGGWSLYFDGSDVGLSAFAIDALVLLPTGELLVSVDVAGDLPGLVGGPYGVSIDDSDLVKFTPTSLGANTAGTWTFFFDGSDVGLTTNSEDIDAVEWTPDNKLLISTLGAPGVSGLSGLNDEDLIQFTPTALGATTAGTWAYYFDGSDVGLADTADEDVDAAALNAAGHVLLSTVGNFSVSGVSGADEDVFEFAPTSLGSNTAGSYSMFLDLSALGISTGADVAAVALAE